MTQPQIISGYDAGYHNVNLSKSINRIHGEGVYKDQSVIAITPSLGLVPFRIFLALRGLITPPNQKFHWMGAQGMEVGEAFSSCIESIINHPDLSKWKYILTVEEDNMPPPDGLVNLIKRMEKHPEYSCIGGLYWTKGYGGVPQIWGDPKDPVLNFRPQKPVENQLVECCGTGMGFNLWRMEMFKDKRLPRPLFKTTASTTEGLQTQDLYFWKNARALGYRCAIDCAVRVGHYDHSGKFGEPDKMW